MIRKMREEELIVYIYLKSSDKYRKYLNLTSYSYTQKKEQSPDILTQQISVDSDCANDGCVALFEHPWVRGKNPEMQRVNKSGDCLLFRDIYYYYRI